MFKDKRPRLALALLLLMLAFSNSGYAQTKEEEAIVKAAAQALTYFQAGRCAEAIPHFDIAVAALPDMEALRAAYGFCLLTRSKQTKSTDEAKQLSARALEQFQAAKRLGLNDPAIDTFISLLSGKSIDSDPNQPQYSPNPEAEKVMIEAESFFARSEYDAAIKLYERALSIDPNIYHAANAAGNAFVAKSDWEMAEKWYQRGIKINPDRETAYRWSATPFMKQKKFGEARDRYIEAFIVEPYNKMSRQGLGQWATITEARLEHPKVEYPEFSFSPEGKAILKSPIKADDKESPWLVYFSSREEWLAEKFSKRFPQKPYRHSLIEETESLRAAITASAERNGSRKHFELLAKLDKEGLLESYVLLSRADGGIAEDHPEYLKTNRAKLRQYVANYLIRK